jgi:actin-related protein
MLCDGTSRSFDCSRECHSRSGELSLCPTSHRIDIGGKLMTNYLKEIVSYRHWYMMDQTSVMEHAKEETCYVSTQWKQDLETAK